jgi:hypothetical protein
MPLPALVLGMVLICSVTFLRGYIERRKVGVDAMGQLKFLEWVWGLLFFFLLLSLRSSYSSLAESCALPDDLLPLFRISSAIHLYIELQVIRSGLSPQLEKSQIRGELFAQCSADTIAAGW